jgi:AbrB family looped-hinge helix DNA binding protein
MAIVKVSSKYQIVIPREIREPMGIKPGQEVAVMAYGGMIHVVPVQPLESLRGMAKGHDLHFERESDREL